MGYEYVDHPAHYNKHGKETIEKMRDIWGDEAVALWCEITAFKYEDRKGEKPNESIEREEAKIKWYKNAAAELREGIKSRHRRFTVLEYIE